MTRQRHDVVCVGCGPAGNLAAYLLASAGLRVLLLEKEALPRTKPCGGGLTARALALLPYDASSVVHGRMEAAEVHLAGGKRIAVASPGIGAMIERAEFDTFMAYRAADAGATLLTQAPVVGLHEAADGIHVETPRGDFVAELLLGADGAHSAVRRLAFPGRRTAFGFALETTVRGIAADPAEWRHAVLDFGAARRGYGWVFPKLDHFNVGVYRLAKGGSGAGLKQALRSFASAQAVLGGGRFGKVVGHPIPLCRLGQPVVRGRVALVGDAAGQGEAFFGEGIGQALRSAHAATEAIVATAGRPVAERAERIASALAPMRLELAASRAAAHLLYALPPPWLARLAASPRLMDAALGFLRTRPEAAARHAPPFTASTPGAAGR